MAGNSAGRYCDIIPPTPDMAADMIRLRSRLLVEELMLAGADPEGARQHVAGWDSPESIGEYREVVANWVADPSRFVRVVTESGGHDTPEIKGLFSAVLPGEKALHTYVSSIQLDPSIRRQGIGRRLFKEVSEADHPLVPIELDVLRANYPARDFYHALGFKAVRAGESFYVGKRVLNVLRMRRDSTVRPF